MMGCIGTGETWGMCGRGGWSEEAGMVLWGVGVGGAELFSSLGIFRLVLLPWPIESGAFRFDEDSGVPEPSATALCKRTCKRSSNLKDQLSRLLL